MAKRTFLDLNLLFLVVRDAQIILTTCALFLPLGIRLFALLLVFSVSGHLICVGPRPALWQRRRGVSHRHVPGLTPLLLVFPQLKVLLVNDIFYL